MSFSMNINISGSEGIIERFRNEDNLSEPFKDMVQEITNLFSERTREFAPVLTGRLKASVMPIVTSPYAGTVGMASFVPYARYVAFGAMKTRNFPARHAENGVTIVDGYGYTNYAFNYALREAWLIAFQARDEVIRRLSE